MFRVFPVEVTADDIACGRRRDLERCPVALALGRLGLGRFSVSYIWLSCEQGFTAISDSETREFIRAFDAGGPVKPFLFSITVDARFCPAPPV